MFLQGLCRERAHDGWRRTRRSPSYPTALAKAADSRSGTSSAGTGAAAGTGTAAGAGAGAGTGAAALGQAQRRWQAQVQAQGQAQGNSMCRCMGRCSRHSSSSKGRHSRRPASWCTGGTGSRGARGGAATFSRGMPPVIAHALRRFSRVLSRGCFPEGAFPGVLFRGCFSGGAFLVFTKSTLARVLFGCFSGAFRVRVLLGCF